MKPPTAKDLTVAVLIPCHNEENTVGTVVAEFARTIPGAQIYVCDNASTDRTGQTAMAAGATVLREQRLGKGNALRRLFSDVDADIFILIDGDQTYDVSAAPAMVELLLHGSLDMVIGIRKSGQDSAYRAGHRIGNRLLTRLVSAIFGNVTADMLSGYRVLSRRYVKSFPALARGFEIEPEMLIHAIELRMLTADFETAYVGRPTGSVSKLSTIQDGLRILLKIILLAKEERPFQLLGVVAIALAVLSLVFGYPVVSEYLETGLVPRLPTALLAATIMLAAILIFIAGLILDSVAYARREARRLAYLQFQPIARSTRRQ